MSFARRALALYCFVFLSLTATPASAYIGAGAGTTMLSALWGAIVVIVLALAAILFWPIRAFLRRRKAASVKSDQAQVNASTLTQEAER